MFELKRGDKMKPWIILLGLVALISTGLVVNSPVEVSSSDLESVQIIQSQPGLTPKVVQPAALPLAGEIIVAEKLETQVIDEPRFREDIYDQVLFDAENSVHEIDRQSLKKFWMAAADFKQFEESFETLDSIINSSVADDTLIDDAKRYRADLSTLSQSSGITTAMATTSVSHENVAEGGGSLSEYESLDSFRIDELAYTLQHGEPENVSAAIDVLSLHRDSQVTELLLQNVDFLPADQYKKVLRTLWFSAADGIDVERIKTYIEIAQLSDDSDVAELAELATVDLRQTEAPGGIVLQEIIVSDPATGCDLAECLQ